MKKHTDRCMGCMNEKLYEGPCAVCGYNGEKPDAEGFLEPETFLSDRYIIGKLISKGGDGAVYIAFDTTENKTVEIKEFMPDTLCRREKDGESIEITEGSMPLFKSYLSEFADLHKTMINEMNSSSLKKEYEIFAANGTGYVVTEHLSGMSFEEFLTSNGGKTTWSDLKDMLTPLLDTLSEMHDKGIVHRGISPSTLFVTNDGRLVLTSVDISAARSAESQINCDTYPGYTACEQYDLSERQGSWTDVYGLCAVLYRALTGIVPPDAQTRKAVDRLVPPADINEEIPKYISDTITEGLLVDRAKRLHDIALLKEKLYNEPSEEPQAEPVSSEPENDGPVTPAVAIKFDPDMPEKPVRHTNGSGPHTQSSKKKKTQQKKKKKKSTSASSVGTIIGIFIFFAMVAALVIAIIYFSEEAKKAINDPVPVTTTTTATESVPVTVRPKPTQTSETEPPPISETKLIMPDLVNRFFNNSLKSRYSMLNFEVEYDYNDTYAENVIYEQDVPKDTPVLTGTTVKLKVSKGPAYTYLPDYVGMPLTEFTSKLVELGIRFTSEAKETDEVKQGYVVECSKAVGDKVYISEDEIVIVYYAVTPPRTEPTTSENTVPPDDEPIESIPEEGGESSAGTND